jgi:hypothetical protein
LAVNTVERERTILAHSVVRPCRQNAEGVEAVILWLLGARWQYNVDVALIGWLACTIAGGFLLVTCVPNYVAEKDRDNVKTGLIVLAMSIAYLLFGVLALFATAVLAMVRFGLLIGKAIVLVRNLS